MEKGLTKNNNSVASALDAQQNALHANVAMKALTLVQPMIESVSNELTDSLGDNETMIIIRCSGKGKPATILFLDTKEDFTIQGAKANKTTANIERDKFIKQARENGQINDEQWAKMNLCDNIPVFRGEINPETKKPWAIKQFYVIKEFVDALLTGRIEEISKKLTQ